MLPGDARSVLSLEGDPSRLILLSGVAAVCPFILSSKDGFVLLNASVTSQSVVSGNRIGAGTSCRDSGGGRHTAEGHGEWRGAATQAPARTRCTRGMSVLVSCCIQFDSGPLVAFPRVQQQSPRKYAWVSEHQPCQDELLDEHATVAWYRRHQRCDRPYQWSIFLNENVSNCLIRSTD